MIFQYSSGGAPTRPRASLQPGVPLDPAQSYAYQHRTKPSAQNAELSQAYQYRSQQQASGYVTTSHEQSTRMTMGQSSSQSSISSSAAAKSASSVAPRSPPVYMRGATAYGQPSTAVMWNGACNSGREEPGGAASQAVSGMHGRGEAMATDTGAVYYSGNSESSYQISQHVSKAHGSSTTPSGGSVSLRPGGVVSNGATSLTEHGNDSVKRQISMPSDANRPSHHVLPASTAVPSGDAVAARSIVEAEKPTYSGAQLAPFTSGHRGSHLNGGRAAQSYAPAQLTDPQALQAAGSRMSRHGQVSQQYTSYQPAPTSYIRSPSDVNMHQIQVGAAADVFELARQRETTPRQQPLEQKLTALEKIPYSELLFLEHLGSGEFGQVYRGQWKGNEVAIKQLYWDSTMKPEEVLSSLQKEIESFRHLNHRRLVKFIGACLEMPYPCLVTEYMPGGSLHNLLHVRKLKLPLAHCVNMCLQLCDGVMYLHSQVPCIVHRDLKSLNVVLDLGLNIKLCDFGLTEPMDRTHIEKKNNGGSPRYMAPELFDQRSKITEKVDVWAMGCIFIEIFGGPLPYEGINTLAELTRELTVHKRAPSIPMHIPAPLIEIVRSCCNFDHRLRPTAKQIFEQMKESKKQLKAQNQL